MGESPPTSPDLRYLCEPESNRLEIYRYDQLSVASRDRLPSDGGSPIPWKETYTVETTNPGDKGLPILKLVDGTPLIIHCPLKKVDIEITVSAAAEEPEIRGFEGMKVWPVVEIKIDDRILLQRTELTACAEASQRERPCAIHAFVHGGVEPIAVMLHKLTVEWLP
jgi:hypothetical protein